MHDTYYINQNLCKTQIIYHNAEFSKDSSRNSNFNIMIVNIETILRIKNPNLVCKVMCRNSQLCLLLISWFNGIKNV